MNVHACHVFSHPCIVFVLDEDIAEMSSFQPKGPRELVMWEASSDVADDSLELHQVS